MPTESRHMTMTSTAHTAATDRNGDAPAQMTQVTGSPASERRSEYQYQELMILLKGGYTPDTIRVAAGRPVRLVFRREETAACSEQVVLADFCKSARLPTRAVAPIEFMPDDPGEHAFTCQMGMIRGRIIVEAA